MNNTLHRACTGVYVGNISEKVFTLCVNTTVAQNHRALVTPSSVNHANCFNQCSAEKLLKQPPIAFVAAVVAIPILKLASIQEHNTDKGEGKLQSYSPVKYQRNQRRHPSTRLQRRQTHTLTRLQRRLTHTPTWLQRRLMPMDQNWERWFVYHLC
jgi:hypothetical protein